MSTSAIILKEIPSCSIESTLKVFLDAAEKSGTAYAFVEKYYDENGSVNFVDGSIAITDGIILDVNKAFLEDDNRILRKFLFNIKIPEELDYDSFITKAECSKT